MSIPLPFHKFKLALGQHPLLTIVVVVGVLLRVLYGVASVQSGEFINWIAGAVERGPEAATRLPYPSIYAASGYIFTLAYGFWSVLPIEHPPFADVYLSAGRPIFQPSFANYLFVFFMKTPIMLLDIFILILIASIVAHGTRSSRSGMVAAAAWAWNPLVTLLENYNGADVSTAFFLLLAAYFFKHRKTPWASIALTVGGFLRLAPLLFFPLFALAHARRREWRELLKVLLPGSLLLAAALLIYATTYTLGIEQLLKGRPGVLVYEALAFMGPILQPRVGISWNGFIPLNLVLYFLLAWLTSSRKESAGFGDPISSVLLAFFATSWFHFSFMLWALPFLTIYNFGLSRHRVLYALLTAGGMLWTVFQASTAVFSFGSSILFVPVSQDLLPLSRQLATLQFYKGLEYLRAFLSGVLLAQLALIVVRNIPQNGHVWVVVAKHLKSYGTKSSSDLGTLLETFS